jgi:hypothetical protein
MSAVVPALQFGTAVILGQEGRYSALSIVNPSNSAIANVRFQVFDSSGQTAGEAVASVPPLNRLSKFVGELVNVSFAPALGFRGSIRVSSNIPIAVAALDVSVPDGKFVNIPMWR